MRYPIQIAAICGTLVGLSGCVTENETKNQLRDAGSNQESVCMQAVNSNYGGNVRDLRVASSEFSEANSLVIIDAVGVRGGKQTERWRCLVSNAGNVEELIVVE